MSAVKAKDDCGKSIEEETIPIEIENCFGVVEFKEEGVLVEDVTRVVEAIDVAVEVPWHVLCAGGCYGDGNLVFIANDRHTTLPLVYLKEYYS
ncbi:hypothetical protein GH714_018852 [Hevea brasiliensis]|uniref:Uncharacterized protein n=1 Tax=Hevea brasiliensis TaxID=3981 RepID=A0A6A6MB47_HEVBR|nr:hypothetical protein GH714_018852 [Hevea brasiliensis]